MTGRALKTPGSWRFLLESGAWIVRLQLPATIKRGEVCTGRWTVSAGTRRTAKLTQVTLRQAGSPSSDAIGFIASITFAMCSESSSPSSSAPA
jgi:hypothetical protein